MISSALTIGVAPLASADSANGQGAGQAQGQGHGQGNASTASTANANSQASSQAPGQANGSDAGSNANPSPGTPRGCANGQNPPNNGQTGTAPGCAHSDNGSSAKSAPGPAAPGSSGPATGANDNGNPHGSITKTISSIQHSGCTAGQSPQAASGQERGSHAAQVCAGDYVSWAVSVTGSGSATISDEYKPSQERFVSADNGGHVAGNKVVWDNVALPKTVILTTQIGVGTPTGFHCNEVITNVGHVDGIGSDQAQVRVICGTVSTATTQVQPGQPATVTTTSPITLPNGQVVQPGTQVSVLSGTITAGGEVQGATISGPGFQATTAPNFLSQVAGVAISAAPVQAPVAGASTRVPSGLPRTGGGGAAR